MKIDLNVAANTITNALYYNVRLKSGKNFPILQIGRDSFIGGVQVDCCIDILKDDDIVYDFQIGQFCSLADAITIIIDMDHDYRRVAMGNLTGVDCTPDKRDDFRIRRKGHVIIENDVWIGHGATIMNGVTIHNGAVVSAKAVVTKDVPPYAIVAGNPARIVKYRFNPEIIDKLMDINWWYWSSETISERRDDFKLDIDKFVYKYHEYSINKKDSIYPIEKKRGVCDYLFYVDYNDMDYPLTDIVIRQFADRFNGDMSVRMVLYLPLDTPDYYDELSRLNGTLELLADYNCQVLICDLPVKEDWELISKCEYYITNRSLYNIQRMNIAYKYGAKCIVGSDVPIDFDNNKH